MASAKMAVQKLLGARHVAKYATTTLEDMCGFRVSRDCHHCGGNAKFSFFVLMHNTHFSCRTQHSTCLCSCVVPTQSRLARPSSNLNMFFAVKDAGLHMQAPFALHRFLVTMEVHFGFCFNGI